MAKFNTRPCSADHSFEFIDFDVPPIDDDIIHVLSKPCQPRRSPVSPAVFHSHLDPDGRLVNEHSLRKAVYLGGIDPSVRKEVWGFLFGLYPCSSTARERDVMLLDYFVKYEELKLRWKKMLVAQSYPSANLIDQGLIAPYQIETTSSPPDDGTQCAVPPHRLDNDIHIPVSPYHPCSLVRDYDGLPFDIHDTEIKKQIDFMRIPAQVFVNRHKLDVKSLKKNIRVIDKDVPRTDRDFEFFKGTRNPHLSELRDMLVTYSAFHPHVGYVQGMNDIIARFLVVFHSEFEAYWCFKSYMDKMKEDFLEDGMVNKIKIVGKLLHELDPHLMNHFYEHEMTELVFLHRWLLLGFKREFSFPDSLRCFEILSCHHMEVSSLEAEKAKRLGEMKLFENDNGVLRPADQEYKSEYTFELFMCVALLIENRQALLLCTDMAMVFNVVNNIKIDLDAILGTSEKLFYQYCKKAVEDCFLVVDSPSIEDLS